MKYLIFATAFSFSLLAQATVQCKSVQTNFYTFKIERAGDHYEISGDYDGSRQGHCQSVIWQRNGHVHLTGIGQYASQCFADIRLDVNRGSEVSVPDNKTYGEVTSDLLLCTGQF